jgi:GNAT superfamily N-acetyltransferase
MSDFIDRYDADADGIWVVMDSGEVAASVTLDATHVHTEGAHLRWFFTSDAVRGRGAGGVLLERAVEHCWERGYGRMYLWTLSL